MTSARSTLARDPVVYCDEAVLRVALLALTAVGCSLASLVSSGRVARRGRKFRQLHPDELRHWLSEKRPTAAGVNRRVRSQPMRWRQAGTCAATRLAPQDLRGRGDCGQVSDGCEGVLDCGTCTAPNSCGGTGLWNVCSCAPKTCAALGAQCGSVSDGCGGSLDCGTCAGGKQCVNNSCGCTPTTCAALGADCGTVADGCGGTLECGSCATGTCGERDRTMGSAPCVPTSCAAEGKNCGTIGDGCGATLECGGCAGADSCGGGGTSNVCGCTDHLQRQGGSVPDGCGGR
jgi:hypothetical protein